MRIAMLLANWTVAHRWHCLARPAVLVARRARRFAKRGMRRRVTQTFVHQPHRSEANPSRSPLVNAQVADFRHDARKP